MLHNRAKIGHRSGNHGSQKNAAMTKTSTSRGRILKGLGATSLGQLVNLISQLVVTPVLIYAWGIERCGEWLVLSCIPSYLALSDAGISSASANEVSMSAARKDYNRANAAFQSTLVFLYLVGAVILAAVSLFVYVIPLREFLAINSISVNELRLVCFLFAISAILGQQQGLWQSVFRCDGYFAFGGMIGVVFKAAELVVFILFSLLNSFVVLLISTICFRLLVIVATKLIAMKCLPWLEVGTKRVNLSFISQVWKPGLAHLAYPLGNAMTVQGTIMLISHGFSPLAVVTFNSHRTLFNATTQLMSVVNYTIWPEIADAYGSGSIDRCRLLHRKSCNWSIWLAVVSVALLAGNSFWILPFWTLGRVQADSGLVLVLSLLIVVRTFWYTSSVVSSSTNRNGKMAVALLVSSVFSLGLLFWIVQLKSLAYVALCLVFTEIVMCIVIVNCALVITSDSFWGLARFVMWPPFDDLIKLCGPAFLRAKKVIIRGT